MGAYELFAWIIRTAATGGPDHVPDHIRTCSWPAPGPVPGAGPADRYGQGTGLAPVTGDNPRAQVPAAVADSRTESHSLREQLARHIGLQRTGNQTQPSHGDPAITSPHDPGDDMSTLTETPIYQA